jgi:GNAT superfamily N-acetyltransferase
VAPGTPTHDARRVEITEVRPDDRDAVRRYVDLENAVRRADSPWSYPLTEHECEGLLRHHWEGEPPTAFLATADGEDVGEGELYTSNYDNLHLAWLTVAVHPGRRRRGHGTGLFDFLVGRTRAVGRRSLGVDGWDSEATRCFAERHGLGLKQHEVNRRHILTEVDWGRLDRLYAEAAPHAAAYELVRAPRRTPDDALPAMAAMVTGINDAPLDDLDIEDEVFTPARVRAYEQASAARGVLLHRLVARHRETGELAGHTVVGVDEERPELGEQHDTSVLRAHRGHRLGLLLKIEMLRWLREDQPQLLTIDTWNAASNEHMIGVNEALGYRVMGRALAFQRSCDA